MEKRMRQWTLSALAAVVASASLWSAAANPPQTDSEQAPTAGGLFFSALSGTDSAEQIDNLLDFAGKCGLNRIYFSCQKSSAQDGASLPSFSIASMDETMQNLTKLAAEMEQTDLSLSLVLDPFVLDHTHPAYPYVRRITQLGGSIAVWKDGVLYLDPTIPQNQQLAQWELQKWLAAGSRTDELVVKSTAFLCHSGDGQANDQVSQAQRMASFFEEISGSGVSISVLYDLPASPYQSSLQWLQTPGLSPQTLAENQLANTVYPAVQTNWESYEAQMETWPETFAGLSVSPFFGQAAVSEDHAAFAISSMIFSARQAGITSFAVDGYEQLAAGGTEDAVLLCAALSSDLAIIPDGYSLEVPQTFSVTRPSGDIAISSSSYYVMGTSNPDLPLYLDGEPIQRQTSNGGFGVYLTDIPIGTSTYTFSQGSQKKTIFITRMDPDESEITLLSNIVQNSMYPSYDEAVKVGEDISLRCTAPAGASVYATFQGKTVQLRQVAVAQEGVPATYTGTMSMPAVGSEDETTQVGSVTYTLEYQSSTTTYSSSGELYAVGENASLAVMANDYINNVYGDVSIEDDFYMTLYNGACDYVEEITDNYYKLRSGGYLPKSTAEILTGSPVVDNQVSAVDFSVSERGETLTLSGTAKAPYRAQMNDSCLTVTLWNTTGIPSSIQAENSTLFRQISSVENEDGSVTLTLDYQDNGALWGYNVEYDGDQIVIFAKKAPQLSGDSQHPLEGVVVVLDAGHGGEDPGALGVAGTNGPTEKDLNFISAYATKQVLESLGATVHMVSEENARLSFEERMDPARSLRADFFLSFHHNSTSESANSGSSFGTEVYYHEEQSRVFAEYVLAGIITATGRDARGAYQDYYRVTRMTYAPSLLLELGFVVNPEEYEDLCRPDRIFQTALGVAKAMVQTIEDFQ